MNGIFRISLIFAVVLVSAKAGYIDLSGGHGQETYEAGGFEHGQGNFGGSDGQSSDYHDEPKYSFNYAVHDPHTGDMKQHTEEREGHVVKGSYSLKEADGSTRVVEYQADKHNGFNAKVHKIASSAPSNEHTDHYNY